MKNAYTNDAAVPHERAEIVSNDKAVAAYAVQQKRGPHTGKPLDIHRLTPEQLDRFWSKVRRGDDDECWPWLAGKSDKGYGAVRVGKLIAKASRVSYEIANGPVPTGLVVMHSCDYPACVNPKHLSVGTQQDNIRDYWIKQSDGLIPIEDAAASLPMDVKRLRGFIFRNKIGDPIGSMSFVYDWSLATLRAKLQLTAEHGSAAP